MTATSGYLRGALLAAVLLSPLASAEVYKWIDERGVTNYGSTPPARTSARVQRVPDQLSVYTPDAALTAAVARERERLQRVEERALLYRELERRGLTQERTTAAPGEHGSPGGGIYDYYGYAPGIVTVPIHARAPRYGQAAIAPGTSAGQSLSPWESYIPGNSAGAYATRQTPVMSRPAAQRTR